MTKCLVSWIIRIDNQHVNKRAVHTIGVDDEDGPPRPHDSPSGRNPRRDNREHGRQPRADTDDDDAY
jgi:hypothetical protein